MLTNDDIHDRLTKLGERPEAEPSSGFVALLDERLRTRIDDYVRQPALVPTRARRPRRVFVPAFAAMVVAVALGVGGLVARSTPSYALTLSDPVNVSVVLPDGRVIAGIGGMRLADGARVIVGAGGSARVGDQHLAEGAVAVIEGRALRLEVAEPTPTTSVPAETTTEPPTSVVPLPPPPTEAPQRPPMTEPPVTEAPAPAPVETTRPVPTTTTTRAPEQNFNLNLQLIVGDGRTMILKWRSITGATRYVVSRTSSTDSSVAPAEPAYPTNEIADTTQLQWTEVVPVGIHWVRYRVVALDGTGKVVSQPAPFVQATLP